MLLYPLCNIQNDDTFGPNYYNYILENTCRKFNCFFNYYKSNLATFIRLVFSLQLWSLFKKCLPHWNCRNASFTSCPLWLRKTEVLLENRRLMNRLFSLTNTELLSFCLYLNIDYVTWQVSVSRVSVHITKTDTSLRTRRKIQPCQSTTTDWKLRPLKRTCVH